ncbi:MAG TPA: ribonuclease HII [Candidatus Paceibacterota bacterium]|nr:ribonuclease HII [Candidatus Paceibacterota bacterium]
MEWLIGIDEAGRGALAGPVCVGAVLYPSDFDWKEAFALITKHGVPKLRDSKQLTAQQRDTLFEYIAMHGRLKHAFAFVDAKIIDEIGIVNASHEGAAVAITALGIRPDRVRVLLDAGLRVPSRWHQESFVRGDETIPAISFASIVAKVMRDRLMEDLAQIYAAYRFEEHKGYGTADHRLRIRKNGLSELHRVTFCSNLFGGGSAQGIPRALQKQKISV